MFVRSQLVLIALFLTCLVAPAQDGTMKGSDIASLLRLGFSEQEIIGSLSRPGITVEVTRAEALTYAENPTTKKLGLWLQSHLPPPAPSAMTVTDIISAWKAHAGEAAIRMLLERSGTHLKLSVDNVLQLNRAGVPESLIRFINTHDPKVVTNTPKTTPTPSNTERETTRPTTTNQRPLGSREQVLAWAGAGVSETDIIARIQTNNLQFDLDADEVLSLGQAGISTTLIREMFRRVVKKEAITSEGSASQPKIDLVSTAVTNKTAPRLHVYKDRASTYSILAPHSFIKVEEFKGRKSLVQMAPPSQGKRDLPDLEISIMHVKRKDPSVVSAGREQLEAVAIQFAKNLKDRFAADSIQMIAKKPTPTWLSGRQAVRIATSATTPSGTGHLGATFLTFSTSGLFAVSYSFRAELAHEWQDTLESCARSLTVTGPSVDLELGEKKDQANAQKLFDAWRQGVAHFDYATFRAAHGNMRDTVDTRMDFLTSAAKLISSNERLEFASYEPGKITFNRFRLDGKTPSTLIVDESGRTLRIKP